MTGVLEPDAADLTLVAATSMLSPTVSQAGEPLRVETPPRPARLAAPRRSLPQSATSRRALPQVASFAVGLVAGGLLTRRLFGER